MKGTDLWGRRKERNGCVGKKQLKGTDMWGRKNWTTEINGHIYVEEKSERNGHVGKKKRTERMCGEETTDRNRSIWKGGW